MPTMHRGELYLLVRPFARDPKRLRVFCIVSRQKLIEARFSTVICAPIYSAYGGLATQVPVGIAEGLKHDSSIHGDELVSLQKNLLTHYVGVLSPEKILALNHALRVALALVEQEAVLEPE